MTSSTVAVGSSVPACSEFVDGQPQCGTKGVTSSAAAVASSSVHQTVTQHTTVFTTVCPETSTQVIGSQTSTKTFFTTSTVETTFRSTVWISSSSSAAAVSSSSAPPPPPSSSVPACSEFVDGQPQCGTHPTSSAAAVSSAPHYPAGNSTMASTSSLPSIYSPSSTPSVSPVPATGDTGRLNESVVTTIGISII